MNIRNAAKFDSLSRAVFGHETFLTFADVEYKIRLELGGNLDGKKRADFAYARAAEVIDSIFVGINMWLRIELWSINVQYSQLGIQDPNTIVFKHQGKESTILYVYYPAYTKEIISSILHAIINFDLALTPSIDMKCYFYNFDIPVVANAYDDRGMDIVTTNTNLREQLYIKYSGWLIKSAD